VRDALAGGDLDAVAGMVPPPTMAFLRSADGAALAATLARERGRQG